MIFLSCDIENFGCLSGFHYNFQRGLNVFHAENGKGKTTFAAFLTAMLYGLGGSTTRNLSENPRKLYTPWQGGIFGGSLTFLVGEKTYRVTRTFGKKESEDTFVLYDTATEMPSTDYPETLGESITGLSRNAYEKSVFISRAEKAPFAESGAEITEKLSDFVEASGDTCTYDEALKILEKQTKIYEKRGRTGKLHEIRDEKEQARFELMNLEKDADALALYRKEEREHEEALATCEKEEARLTDLTIHATAKDAKDALIRHHLSLKNEVKVAEDTVSASLSSLGGSVPTDDMLTLLEQEGRRANETKIAADNTRLSPAEEEEMLRLSTESDPPPTSSPTQTSPKTKRAMPFFLGFLLLLALSIPFFFLSVPVGIGLSAASLLSLALALYFYLSFKKVSGDTAPLTAVPEISERARRLSALRLRAEGLAEERERKLSAYGELRSRLLSRLTSYGMTGSDEQSMLSSLRLSVLQHRAAEVRLSTSRQRLADFLSEHPEFVASGGSDAPSSSAVTDSISLSLSDIETKKQENRAKIAQEKQTLLEIRKNIALLAAKVASIDRIQKKIDDLTLAEAAASRNLRALLGAVSFLTSARATLASRYLAPMQARLDGYLARLLPAFDSRPVLDSNLALTVENRGVRREPVYFSRGTQDLLSFCLHLSLSDALTEKEPVCLVIDDVFADYDEEKLRRAGSFLRELGNTRQILYFTCHASRTLKA